MFRRWRWRRALGSLELTVVRQGRDLRFHDRRGLIQGLAGNLIRHSVDQLQERRDGGLTDADRYELEPAAPLIAWNRALLGSWWPQPSGPKT